MNRRVKVATSCLAALLAALSVFLINGTGLFYFDTGGYLHAGDGVFEALGLGGAPAMPVLAAPPNALPLPTSETTPAPALPPVPHPDPVPEPAQAVEVAPTDQPGTVLTAAASTVQPPAQSVVIGNRSALYGVVLSFAARTGWLDLVVLVNLGALWLAIWIVVRVVQRDRGARPEALAASAWLILAGCAGSLPFYVAFLMPDLLAPVLILMLAVLCIYPMTLQRGERAAAFALALFAVLSHPSHLLMGAMLVPLGAFISPATRRYRWRMFAALLVLVLGLGIAERVAFNRVVEVSTGASVIILPFLTARLIDDGAGRAYLADHCPDSREPACALYDMLQRPGEKPERFDAPVILFSPDPAYGSYRLLAETDQQRIARDQVWFALRVIGSRPVSVVSAIAWNVIDQLEKSGIAMTIPTQEIVDRVVMEGGRIGPKYGAGRLIGLNPAVLQPVIAIHAAVYGLSALGIALFLAIPGGARRLAPFVWMVLCGIVVNALVCGAVSEPADRYGARTMFLLPVMLALLIQAARQDRSGRRLLAAVGRAGSFNAPNLQRAALNRFQKLRL